MEKSYENFVNFIEANNIRVREVSPRFPFQDPKQECFAYYAYHQGKRLYVCFSSEGDLLQRLVEQDN